MAASSRTIACAFVAVLAMTGCDDGQADFPEAPAVMDETGVMQTRPRVVWTARVDVGDGDREAALAAILRTAGAGPEQAAGLVERGAGAVVLADGLNLLVTAPRDRSDLQVTVERLQ